MENKKTRLGKIHSGNVRLKHSTTAWLTHAYELKRAEELIYLDILRDYDKILIERKTKNFTPSPITPNKVHFLIIGFAIENLLKCLYLTKYPELIQEGEIKDGVFGKHNLIQIAREKLSLALNEDEKFILDLGTKAITWYGKYPIPLKEKDTLFIVETNHSHIHTAFHIFFQRLRNMIPKHEILS